MDDKKIEQLVEEKAKEMNLSAHQREVYRKMLEGRSVEAQINEGYEKEWNADYVYGEDEGEINKGNVRE